MSHSALLVDLRARGEQQIATLRRQAREKIDSLRAEADQQLAEAESQCQLTAGQSRETVRRKMAVTAQRQASLIATRAEQKLNNRLYGLGIKLLNGLHDPDRAILLSRLAAEISDNNWQTIIVHPDDQAVARKLFPQAEILTNQDICGGLIASSSHGRITVINTLEKRLERLWPQLAPEILQDVVTHEQRT